MTTKMIQHAAATVTAHSEFGTGEVTLSAREIKTLMGFAHAAKTTTPEAQKAVAKLMTALLETQHHFEI